jgi:hypothetical protein
VLPHLTATAVHKLPNGKMAHRAIRHEALRGQPIPRSDAEPNTLGVFMRCEERDRLLEERPSGYYLTDHFANYPAVLVRLGKISRAELREILSAAWQSVMEASGPKKRSRGTATKR